MYRIPDEVMDKVLADLHYSREMIAAYMTPFRYHDNLQGSLETIKSVRDELATYKEEQQ